MENKEILPMGLDEIYVNTLMESGEIINEYESPDSRIGKKFSDNAEINSLIYRGYEIDDILNKNPEARHKFDLMTNNLGGASDWDSIPENRLKRYIRMGEHILDQFKLTEAVINQHSKAFYSQMYDFLKDNEDALDFMKKEFVAAYRNSTNKEEYMNNLLKSGALTKTDKEIEDENRNYGKMTTESKETVNESVTTYNGIYITLIPENGGLKIELTESGKEFAEENGLSEMNFWELMDDVEDNSDFAYISDLGNAGFGLTEAPGIIWGFDIGDDGELIETPDSELFYYNNYMIDDFGVKLAKNGYVIFHGQDKKNKIDEKSDPLYKNHKGLYKTTINGFKVFEYNGKFIVYFNVGKKEHSFMWNGGSKSWIALENKLKSITPKQALADKELN